MTFGSADSALPAKSRGEHVPGDRFKRLLPPGTTAEWPKAPSSESMSWKRRQTR